MKSLIVMFCMTTLLCYGAQKENINLDTVNFEQPIAIAQTVKPNEISFKAYLANHHIVTVCPA